MEVPTGSQSCYLHQLAGHDMALFNHMYLLFCQGHEDSEDSDNYEMEEDTE